MRAILFVACAGVGACAVDSELQYRSTVQSETDGVAVSDDGLTTYAAMAGTTCALDTRWGCPVSDEDLPTDSEQVVDHYQGRTLALTDGHLYFLDGDSWDPTADLLIPGVRTARLSDVGVLALRGTTAGCFLGDTAVTGALCGDDVHVGVDRTGALVVATPTGVFRADATGAVPLSGAADRVAVDPVVGRVFLALAGANRVTALDSAGRVLWTHDEAGLVRDVAVRGDKGDLLVLSEDDGFGLLRRLDGATGEELGVGRIPDSRGEVLTSYNGRTVVIVTGTAVHHFELVIDGEEAVVNDEDVTCQDLPVRQSQGFGLD